MDKEKAEEVAEWLKCCVDDCCGKCSKCSAFVEESLGECALIRTCEKQLIK